MLSFFFSSRRRHTIYWRDWSSDVCSSDLSGARSDPTGQQKGIPAARGGPGNRTSPLPSRFEADPQLVAFHQITSLKRGTQLMSTDGKRTFIANMDMRRPGTCPGTRG